SARDVPHPGAASGPSTPFVHCAGLGVGHPISGGWRSTLHLFPARRRRTAGGQGGALWHATCSRVLRSSRSTLPHAAGVTHAMRTNTARELNPQAAPLRRQVAVPLPRTPPAPPQPPP